MNPLNAQQISRFENSQPYQTLSRREASHFLIPGFKAFTFITRLFTVRSASRRQARTA